jgi:hypothetical protein
MIEALEQITGEDFSPGIGPSGHVERYVKKKHEIQSAIEKWWTREGRREYGRSDVHDTRPDKDGGRVPAATKPEAGDQTLEQPTEQESPQARPQLVEVGDFQSHMLPALTATLENKLDLNVGDVDAQVLEAIGGEILWRLQESERNGGPPSIAKDAKEYRLPPHVVQMLAEDFESSVMLLPARNPDWQASWRIGYIVYVAAFTMEEKGLTVRDGSRGITTEEQWQNRSACDYLLFVGEKGEATVVARGTHVAVSRSGNDPIGERTPYDGPGVDAMVVEEPPARQQRVNAVRSRSDVSEVETQHAPSDVRQERRKAPIERRQALAGYANAVKDFKRLIFAPFSWPASSPAP